MRYAAGCLCSALLASVFTFWLTQPSQYVASAQESGPTLPNTPNGPSQTNPPGLSPRQSFDRTQGGNEPPADAPRTNANAPTMRSEPLPSLRPTPDPISSDPLPTSENSSGRIIRENQEESSTSHLLTGELTPDEAINVAVYEHCNRAVVNITSKGVPGDRFLFMEVPADGSGSGTIIDQQGHILTNYHVIENAQQVEVALFDGSTFDAKFVGADPVYDLAVIRIDAPGEKLFPIEIGDSSRLKVGMRVFAIGNPFGLERTMTQGIVSSLNRSLQIRGNRSIKAIIQTDAAINPGNSGGPLLDTRGQLVGVNTAIATAAAGQSAGVALSIPATLVDRVVPQLLRHGRVIRPEIGIQQVLETEKGLRIAALSPGGPAERAGLRGPQTVRRGPFVFTDRTAADLIVSVDGEEAKTADDFLGFVERKRPGEVVVLQILRGNQKLDISVTLGGVPPEPIVKGAQPPL